MKESRSSKKVKKPQQTKKTVLFIVEGKSDKAALEKIFRTIYKKDRNIEFKFTRGDITSTNVISNPELTLEEVEEKIYNVISDFIRDKKLKRSDIYQVIQIFDTDGAFVLDSAIIQGETYKYVYTTQTISCKDTKSVKERNAQKSKLINQLLDKKVIHGWPYEMYFMSRNLDHALYDEIELDPDLKQAYADRFYEMFIGREHLFIEFLKTDVVNGVPDTMSESWKYIKDGVHSLERHTNLHVYFLQHPVL